MGKINLRIILLVLVIQSVSFGQSISPGSVFLRFSVWKATTGAEDITIQQPATGSRNVYLEIVNLYCTVAAVVELEKDGTAATATALASVAIGRSTATATAKAFSASDVGAGTKVSQFRLKASIPLSLDMGDILMQGDGTGINYTLKSDCTGDGEYYIRWREE